MISIVNIKNSEYDVYIGRANSYYDLDESIFHNPFPIGNQYSRDLAILKYRLYINSQPNLLRELPSLKDKTLGCWCSPLKCHGDVLKELAESKNVKNWFSNMLPLDNPFIYQDIEYKTSENFYQAMKLPRSRVDLRKEIAQMSPYQAKKAIRDKTKNQWDEKWNRERSLKVMKRILTYKFQKDTTWAEKLKLTENWELVEWNNWNDLFWGKDLKSEKGENQLGKILMEIRNLII